MRQRKLERVRQREGGIIKEENKKVEKYEHKEKRSKNRKHRKKTRETEN